MAAESFEAASKAAESWLNTVSVIAHLGKGGNVDAAYHLLLPSPERGDRSYALQNSWRQHAAVLKEMLDGLAVVSDGPVKWEHGRGLSAITGVPNATYPHVWSSAHEAAVGIAPDPDPGAAQNPYRLRKT